MAAWVRHADITAHDFEVFRKEAEQESLDPRSTTKWAGTGATNKERDTFSDAQRDMGGRP